MNEHLFDKDVAEQNRENKMAAVEAAASEETIDLFEAAVVDTAREMDTFTTDDVVRPHPGGGPRTHRVPPSRARHEASAEGGRRVPSGPLEQEHEEELQLPPEACLGVVDQGDTAMTRERSVTYYVWYEGEDEDSGLEVTVPKIFGTERFLIEDAAERYLQQVCESDPECGSYMVNNSPVTVHVRDPQGVEHKVAVEVEVELVYYGTIKEDEDQS
jgi:hypothetical protein